VQGGGYDLRPTPTQISQRVPYAFDNSYSSQTRGDFAVPTLFNGNFNTLSSAQSVLRSVLNSKVALFDRIPGWNAGVFSPNPLTVSSPSIVDRFTDPTLRNVYTPINGETGKPDYAVELSLARTLTHNKFVVPEWGALRFDLHVPKILGISQLQSIDGIFQKLKVTLETVDGEKLLIQKTPGGPLEEPEIILEAARGTATEYAMDRWRIGYGEEGFETFTVRIQVIAAEGMREGR
jgi:hypothetical protein